jgi:hypothetical protein
MSIIRAVAVLAVSSPQERFRNAPRPGSVARIVPWPTTTAGPPGGADSLEFKEADLSAFVP